MTTKAPKLNHRIGPWPAHRLREHAAHLRSLRRMETTAIAGDVDLAAEILEYVDPGRPGDVARLKEMRDCVHVALAKNIGEKSSMSWLSDEVLS